MFESFNIDWSFLWAKHSENKPNLQQQFTDWLYSDWSKEKYEDYKVLNMVPGISHYMDYLLDIRADSEYLKRYDMDYTDIHDPRKLSQTSSGAALYGMGYRMISRNISRLYND